MKILYKIITADITKKVKLTIAPALKSQQYLPTSVNGSNKFNIKLGIYIYMENMADTDDSTIDTLDMLKDWTLDAIYAETAGALKAVRLAPTNVLMERLQYYRVVDHPDKLEKGAHVCYFKRDESAPAYIHTGIFCRINPRVTEKCGTWLVCKNYGTRADRRPVFYQICFDAHVVFQRFTADQEVLIKSAELLL